MLSNRAMYGHRYIACLLAVVFALLLGLVAQDAPAASSATQGTINPPSEQSFTAALKRAVGGDPKAQTDIGAMYSTGTGVNRDPARAIQWWQKAAMQGHAGAQFNLGQSYLMGNGAPMDMDKAAD